MHVETYLDQNEFSIRIDPLFINVFGEKFININNANILFYYHMGISQNASCFIIIWVSPRITFPPIKSREMTIIWKKELNRLSCIVSGKFRQVTGPPGFTMIKLKYYIISISLLLVSLTTIKQTCFIYHWWCSCPELSDRHASSTTASTSDASFGYQTMISLTL